MADSVYSHSKAALALPIATSIGALALNIANQKYGAQIPDWTIV